MHKPRIIAVDKEDIPNADELRENMLIMVSKNMIDIGAAGQVWPGRIDAILSDKVFIEVLETADEESSNG